MVIRLKASYLEGYCNGVGEQCLELEWWLWKGRAQVTEVEFKARGKYVKM